MPGILIAEDELELRILLSALFEMEGFAVFQAEDGISAMETFSARRDSIDLLITDLGLPGLGGLELIMKIRAIKPSVKIIAASGYGRATIREEVLQAGGDLFYPKPFSVDDILLAAKQLLHTP
jgi:two-component system, OmpR family, KDP operon response regulator KdpE